ncbi:MAG: phosphate signaling complex protein PhoU [Bacilli bacterium]|nr:phosphate signaling complex protein PhoU [Bacilli bacterium]MCI7622172.1 phosphate signaling complex protein PhoU [Bacilli bacterium]MDD7549288.1 phosphate signaling complex protein PhoU [Bacilli bacterium]MDD7598421.1 phosphate signaling complex protein PhoU [Bacilli bacterium]MDY5248390.1 phosphate signaling complex protein PhoU [Bacilli bacterium]
MNIDKEINNLVNYTMKMGELVLDNLQLAMSTYYHYDEETANKINDDVVDANERLIEEMCLNLMLKERPFARDLRVVSGILKLVEDLERLGDHAEDIKAFAKKLKDYEYVSIKKLDEAYKESTKMVLDSISSLVNKDEAQAYEVIKNDDKVDALYEEALEEIIEGSKENKYPIEYSIYTTLITKYIERIADHAVNVAEWVIYILRGFHKDKQIF